MRYLLSGITLITLLFWPTLSSAGKIVPSTFSDLWVSLWSLWWCGEYLRGAVPHLYKSSLIFAPNGADLLLHNISESILLPAALILSPLSLEFQYTLLCWSIFILNFMAAFYLFKEISHSLKISLWFGILFTIHPFFLGHLAGGHLNLIISFPISLISLALMKIIAEPRSLTWQILLLVCLALLGFTDFYLLYFALLILVGISILSIREIGLRSTVKSIILPSALGILIPSPKIIGAAALAYSRSYTPNHDPLLHSTDLFSFFIPARTQLIGGMQQAVGLLSELQLNWAESGAYIGISLFLLVVTVLVANWKSKNHFKSLFLLITGAALFFLLALGPILFVGGTKLLTLPFYETLNSVLPFFPPVPARFVMPGIFLLFMALALGLKERRFTLTTTLLMLISVIEFFPSALFSTEIPALPALHELKNDTSISRIFDFGEAEKAMYRQTLHQKEIYGGYIARRPRAFYKSLRNNKFVNLGKTLSIEPAKIRIDFDKLGVQGILVERSNVDLLSKLATLSWLRVRYEDPTFVCFRVDNINDAM